MTRYLFYILVALIPFGVLTRVSAVPFITFSFQEVIVLAIVIVSFQKILGFIRKKNKFVVIFAIFAVISTIGLFFNTKSPYEFMASIAYLVRLTLYILVFIPLLSLEHKTIE